MFQIVLHQPKIPQNTGNVVRTCAVTGCQLVLIEPLGFSLTDRQLKRAGLDYWLGVPVMLARDLLSHLAQSTGRAFFFSSKAERPHSDARFSPGDLLVFGSETEGLPEEIHTLYADQFFALPMLPNARCLNLASAVTAVVYEAWRQNGFYGSDLSSRTCPSKQAMKGVDC